MKHEKNTPIDRNLPRQTSNPSTKGDDNIILQKPRNNNENVLTDTPAAKHEVPVKTRQIPAFRKRFFPDYQPQIVIAPCFIIIAGTAFFSAKLFCILIAGGG